MPIYPIRAIGQPRVRSASTTGEFHDQIKWFCALLLATPDGHERVSYRNFFHPSARWQFSSLRLAEFL